jgi:hypothetical protein
MEMLYRIDHGAQIFKHQIVLPGRKANDILFIDSLLSLDGNCPFSVLIMPLLFLAVWCLNRIYIQVYTFKFDTCSTKSGSAKCS